MKAQDENDKLIAGTLPHDPFEGLAPVQAPGAPPALPAPWAGRWKPLDRDTFASKPPSRRWLLKCEKDGVLPLGKVGMLAAEGGAGKTMALTQLAIAVATGGFWLGKFKVPNAGRVLLALGEEDGEEIRRRMYQAGAALKLDENDRAAACERIVTLPLAGMPCAMVENDERGNWKDTSFLAWLREQLKSGEWSLLLFDPLSRFAGADAEKDNAAATRFVQAVESMVSAPGAPTVLVAHHTNKLSRSKDSDVKGTTGAARGSSALTDGVRWVASLDVERLDGFSSDAARSRLGELVTFSVTKSNYAKKPDPLQLRRDGEHGGALLSLDEMDVAELNDARAASSKGREANRPKTKGNASSGREGSDDGDGGYGRFQG